MKRMFILVAIALFLTGSLFADEAILIDFSTLEADVISNQDGVPTQHGRTLMDFANVAGGGFTEDQLMVMKTSLALPNWEVRLSSSSRTVENIGYSFVRPSPSKQWGNVMGVRVHMPLGPNYVKAWIRPPFEIPAFEPQAEVDADGNIAAVEGTNGITTPSRFEAPAGDDGKVDITQPAYGVVKNVGTIKSVEVNAYGLNFPHGLSVILIDSDGIEKSYFMGYLNYEGWRPLRWNNPQYISEVRNRELRIYPLYPLSTPFVKFGGFMLQRDADHVGGDFIAYFKDVKIIYDRAVANPDRDIDDEAVWSIIYDRETQKKQFEMQ
ncbi:MAG: flagellar filament outer layer protein FlaA, partial [Treponema sp.]|nr:flagellar filament outer layer protein FlaA [Treponema sp.]